VVVGVVAARTHLLVEVGGRGRDLLVAEPVPQPRHGGLLVDFGPKAAGVGLAERRLSAAAAFQGQAYISGASLYLILPLFSLAKTIAHVFRESTSQHLH